MTTSVRKRSRSSQAAIRRPQSDGGSRLGSRAQPCASISSETAAQSIVFMTVLLRAGLGCASRSLRLNAHPSPLAEEGKKSRQASVQAGFVIYAFDPVGILFAMMAAGS